MTVKYVIMAVEIFFLILFMLSYPVLNSGNAAGLLFFMTLLVITYKFKPFCKLLGSLWEHGWGKAIILLTAVFLIAGFTYVGILSVKMYKAQKNEPDNAKLIVVLGCKVKGEKPSRILRMKPCRRTPKLYA